MAKTSTKLGLIAVILTSFGGAAFAQNYSVQPPHAEDYSAIYGNFVPPFAEPLGFDRSGTRGRLGLGANQARPEGPGNVSN